MSYPPSQKPPIWSIDPGVIAYNCQKAGIPHPVGAWPFWEGAGNRARDYSGRGNHGTLTNGATWVPNGIDFNGTDGYVNCGSNSSIDDIFSGGGSLCAWIYPETQGGSANPRIIDKALGSGIASGYALYVYAATQLKFGVDFTGTDARWYAPAASISLNKRQFVCVTYNSDSASNLPILYIDGVSQTVGGVNPTGDFVSDNAQALDVGSATGSGCFDGLIENVGMFNTILSASQVKFISANPYFMYQIPEELYGYVAGAPPTGNPFWYYNMLRRRN